MGPQPDQPRFRVLVVDDEPLVANAARRYLARVHDVEVAHSGRAALERLSTERFDAILCDVMMPGMTGIELHGLLPPEVAARMVFLTGGVCNAAAEAFLRQRHPWFLEKPFDPNEMLALVASRIAQTRADTLALGARMV